MDIMAYHSLVVVAVTVNRKMSHAHMARAAMAVVFSLSPLQLVMLAALLVVLVIGWRWYFVIGVPCRSKQRMDGKTVIITGGNTGIGKETAVDLVERGARVILACRDETRAEAAVADIKKRSGSELVLFRKLDLASLASVRQFSERILREEPQIHVLINNAGVMFPPYTVTEDGYELTFAVNHLGHFLLTLLLLDRIKSSPSSRILIISSHAHYPGSLDFSDMMWKKRYQPQFAYMRSKLANVMFARELAKLLVGTGVTVYAIHPGSVNTELPRHLQTYCWGLFGYIFSRHVLALFTKTPLQGAQTSIHCAVASEAEGITGKYWSDCALKGPSRTALDNEACRRLWEYSKELVGL